MKNITVLIDTNIFIDVLQDRIPFTDNSQAVIGLVTQKKIKGAVAAHSITNLWYILRKTHSDEERRNYILSLFEIESVFIGLLAGIIGSLSTYILAFPINYMINKSFSYYSVGRICNFTFYHALIIIFISVVISMISSFLPSHKASRVTPIESLRSE